MPETVIVTLRFGGKEADFELPSRTPLSALEDPLKRALRLAFPGVVFQNRKLWLRSADGYLKMEHTLEDYSIFDGSLLEVGLLDSL